MVPRELSIPTEPSSKVRVTGEGRIHSSLRRARRTRIKLTPSSVRTLQPTGGSGDHGGIASMAAARQATLLCLGAEAGVEDRTNRLHPTDVLIGNRPDQKSALGEASPKFLDSHMHTFLVAEPTA